VLTADVVQEICPDCGVKLPPVASPGHAYLGASSSCWALYSNVLAREYSSPVLMKSVHRLTVDAYAAQHPGVPTRKTIQSAWVHLAGLYLTVQEGRANQYATRVIGMVAAHSDHLSWLAPPTSLGTVTIVDIESTRGISDHEAAVRRWARDVWDAWKQHHQTVQTVVSHLIKPIPLNSS
jgi:hypothetical protein